MATFVLVHGSWHDGTAWQKTVAPRTSDIVLLSHSFGGTIISKVAETIPERIRRLVFLNAFVLQDGNSLNDEVPKSYVDLFDPIAKASADNTVMLPFPVWREAFIK
jgi:pimeloyl-ACP methyl ester carboxylesterase